MKAIFRICICAVLSIMLIIPGTAAFAAEAGANPSASYSTILSCTLNDGGGVHLCWQKLPDAKGYVVLRREKGSSIWTNVKNTYASVSYNDNSVTPLTEYYYKVKPAYGTYCMQRYIKTPAPVSGLTETAAHTYYIGSTDKILSNYGKGDYVCDTLTVGGTDMGREQVLSVKDVEALAYEHGLGFEEDYSLLTRGSIFSVARRTGVKVYDMLVYLGMDADTPDSTPVSFASKDGYAITLTIKDLKSKKYCKFSDITDTQPDMTGLPVMLSFGSEGIPLVGPTGAQSVTTQFGEKDGYFESADNIGGPLRLTIGQIAANEFNAPNNSKWISRITVDGAASYTAHTGSDAEAKALDVNVYDQTGGGVISKHSYTYKDIESFAAQSSSYKKSAYFGADHYEGAVIWQFLAREVTLPGYEGTAKLIYSDGTSEQLDLAYLRNLSGVYTNYTTQRDGLTLTGVRPMLAYGKNGAPTSGPALYAALPSDGMYKSAASVKQLSAIDIYVGLFTDKHSGTDAEKEIRLAGSGLTSEHTVKVKDIEALTQFITSGIYGGESFRGISLYDYLSYIGLTVDAGTVMLSNAEDSLSFDISELQGSADTMLAYSKNGSALTAEQGGPLMALSPLYSLDNISEITVVAKSGLWKHSEEPYAQYISHTLRIHGSEAAADVTLTLADIEAMDDICVRDSFAASAGKNAYQGVILRELIKRFMPDGADMPSEITICADDYRASINVNDIWNGIESHYQDGETRDIIIAYSIDGHPLVPGISSEGYDAVNAFGPMRLIVENTISSWVKNVNEIIIGQ